METSSDGLFFFFLDSLLLGFGLSLGSQTWYLFTNDAVLGQDASSCSPADSGGSILEGMRGKTC